MKKLNNMKSKIKAITDLRRTGNKKIILLDWQKKLLALWNTDEDNNENPVLNRVPGVTSTN